MKKILLILMLALILVLPIINAEESFVFKQNEEIDLKIPVYDESNNRADNSIDCFITVRSPDSDLVVSNGNMTFNTGGIFNYTLGFSNVSELGTYAASVSCEGGTVYGFSTFSIKVTPSGFTGTLGFYILVLIFSLGIILLGFYMEDATITILGSFGLYFMGLFILFYGIDGLKDATYTWALGIIVLMLAAYISLRSAYELIVD